jgi:hypothetical protein
VLRYYQNDKERIEIVNRWHAANKKSDEKVKKGKSKDNPVDCSASRRSDFSTPIADTEHKKDIRVDELPNLDDALLKVSVWKRLATGLGIKGLS